MRGGPLFVGLLAMSVVMAGCTESGSNDEVQGSGPAPEPTATPWNFTLTTVDDAVFKVREPSIEVAPDGTIWITGPTGLSPGLVSPDPTVYTRDHGLFSSRDGGATWVPNTPIPTYGRDLCPGGGDSDLAIAPDGAMFLVDLNLVSVPIAASTDGGDTWVFNCHSNTVPVMDREWVEASEDHVWVMANQLPAGPMLWRAERTGAAVDGLVFGVPMPVPLSGPIERDPSDGTLYLAGSAQRVAVSMDDGASWVTRETGNEYASGGYFENVAIDDVGNIFHAGAGRDGVFIVASADKGQTWSTPALIHPYDGDYMFAWAAAHDDGVVSVAWYGRPAEDGPLGGPEGWNLYAAQSSTVLDGLTSDTLKVARVTPEPITTKGICSGFGCDGLDRSATHALGDFFETAVDKEGHFIIAFNQVTEAGEPVLMFAREDQ